jgi:WD repeat-containing protein 19
MGNVKKVVMNETWAAALTDGQVFVHQIQDDTEQMRKFPQNKNNETPIADVEMAGDFLILIDSLGKIKYYLIEDNAVICEHQSQNPIVKVFPNPSGTKLICIDNTGNGYMYNPVDDSSLFIPNFPSGTQNVLWDIDDPNLFITAEKEAMQTYLFTNMSLEGTQILHLPEYLKLEDVEKNVKGLVTFVDRDLKPLILKSGFVYSSSKQDGIRGQFLQTHTSLSQWRGPNDTEEGHLRYFLQNLALKKYDNCLESAK